MSSLLRRGCILRSGSRSLGSRSSRSGCSPTLTSPRVALVVVMVAAVDVVAVPSGIVEQMEVEGVLIWQ